jgi:hypothetical protein
MFGRYQLRRDSLTMRVGQVGKRPGLSLDTGLRGPVYGRGVRGALDYVLVVILGCLLVASLVLVAIVVLKGSPV